MAHLLFTSQQVSRSMLGAIRNRSTLARIFAQDFSTDFVPGRGAAVSVKAPVMVDKARVYTKANRDAEDAITYSQLSQPYRVITLEDQVYNAVKLPDDFVTFTLENMEQQVVAPMAESVADGINAIIAGKLDGIDAGLTAIDRADKGKYVAEDGTSYTNLNALKAANKKFAGFGVKTSVKANELTATDNAGVMKAIRAAWRLLGERGVPTSNRYLVVGTGWAAALLATPNLFKVNEAGTDGLLREATLGSLYGFTIITDATIDPYAAYAIQRDALTVATRTPAKPAGAAFASTIAQDGFALRYLHDYDPDHLQDRAVVDIFAGAEVLDAQRVVKLTGRAGIEEPATAAAPSGD